MPSLLVNIVRFVDETQPGVVACEFTDAYGRKHTLIDKAPVFTEGSLWWDSEYPQPGSVECVVLEQYEESGRALARIRIGAWIAEGEGEFVIPAPQVV
jgi:hypothetical protein